MTTSKRLIRYLATMEHDGIVYDLEGIKRQYQQLQLALPNTDIRFAMKACSEPAIVKTLIDAGCGIDAASLGEMNIALNAGIDVERMHFGNTIKSDQQIRAAYWLGIRDFACDTLEDLQAISRCAPNANVFVRISTDGEGAVYGLSHKFGVTHSQALTLLINARELGLSPAGISLHIGSQQLTSAAWSRVFEVLQSLTQSLKKNGIQLKYINLGGGLPSLGYMDKTGKPLTCDLEKIFKTIRSGINTLNASLGYSLAFWLEPGRHLVAQHGAIRTHTLRLAKRENQYHTSSHWLFLACGRFNGLYETDALRYPLIFPGHKDDHCVPATLAGPTCDSDDTMTLPEHPIKVPNTLQSGDPIWVLNCGAYATSYSTVKFNGFSPLTITTLPELALEGAKLDAA